MGENLLTTHGRRVELEKELEKLRLSLRHDSRLSYCYINCQTSPEWTASKVANECAMMHWLHNFTDYEERCRVAAIQERTWWCEGRGGRLFADHMKRRVYPVIKESILAERGGFPEKWPWLAEKSTTTNTTTSSTLCTRSPPSHTASSRSSPGIESCPPTEGGGSTAGTRPTT